MNDRKQLLHDLLADRALGRLSPAEQIELAQLLVEFPDEDLDAFDRAAAAIAVAQVGSSLEAMPDSLAARLDALAASATIVTAPAHAPIVDLSQTLAMPDRPMSRPPPAVVAPPTALPVEKERGRGNLKAIAVAGWMFAAAAGVVLAVGAWRAQHAGDVVSTVVEARDKLAAAKGTAVLPWSATSDPAGAGANGDVVWNAVEQRGYMRFRGLAKNDPRVSQYQLWIFDKGRDDRYPVDGGVFDVDKETGDVVVPIAAKLAVGEPVLFAVTIEKPGGVVVSKRERIVVTAKPTG